VQRAAAYVVAGLATRQPVGVSNNSAVQGINCCPVQLPVILSPLKISRFTPPLSDLCGRSRCVMGLTHL